MNYELFNKKVKVICNDNKEFTGFFTDIFEEESILVGMIEIKISEIKTMIEVK